MNDKVLYESTKRITQGFKTTHLGVDLGTRSNEQENIVKAFTSGTIVGLVDGKDRNRGSTGMESYGNYVLIDHGNGFKTRYAHLKKGSFFVVMGQKVNEDTPLGIMGESGNAYGRHLHFEVINNGKRMNPIPYLQGKTNKKITYQGYDLVKKKWLNSIVVGEGIGILSYAGNFGNALSGLRIDAFIYRVHDKVKNKWLHWIVGNTGSGILSYAGNLENPIDGIQIQGAIYRSHLKGGDWLSWISKIDETNQGYSGIYGKEIDAIQIKNKND